MRSVGSPAITSSLLDSSLTPSLSQSLDQPPNKISWFPPAWIYQRVVKLRRSCQLPVLHNTVSLCPRRPGETKTNQLLLICPFTIRHHPLCPFVPLAGTSLVPLSSQWPILTDWSLLVGHHCAALHSSVVLTFLLYHSTLSNTLILHSSAQFTSSLPSAHMTTELP